MVKNVVRLLKNVLEYLIVRYSLESFEKSFYTLIKKKPLYSLILKKEYENLLKGIPMSKSFKIIGKQYPELIEILEFYSRIENLPKKEKKKALKIFNYLYEINEEFMQLKQFLKHAYIKTSILNIMLAFTYSIFPWLTAFLKIRPSFTKQSTFQIFPNLTELILFYILCLVFVFIASLIFQEKSKIIKQLLLTSIIYWLFQIILFILFSK